MITLNELIRWLVGCGCSLMLRSRQFDVDDDVDDDDGECLKCYANFL